MFNLLETHFMFLHCITSTLFRALADIYVTAFLVLCNRLVAAIVSLALIKCNKESLVNAAPIKNFFMISMSNVFATLCQYEGPRFLCPIARR